MGWIHTCWHWFDKGRQNRAFTEEFAGDHLQLLFHQPPTGGSEKLPAQHLCKLRPGGGGTVGEEHDVLGKQRQFQRFEAETERGKASVMFRPRSDLGVLADHVEPEDRRPGALLLAGVGDDDHREGGGLWTIPALKLETTRWFWREDNSGRTCTCSGMLRSLYWKTVSKQMMWSSSVTLREICQTHKDTQIIILKIRGISSTVIQTMGRLTSLPPFPPPDFCSFRVCKHFSHTEKWKKGTSLQAAFINNFDRSTYKMSEISHHPSILILSHGQGLDHSPQDIKAPIPTHRKNLTYIKFKRGNITWHKT